MKSFLFLMTCMAFLLLISNNSFAAPYNYTGMTIMVKKSNLIKVLELRVGNLQNQTTHISIQDLQGRIGLSLNVKNQDTYVKNIDLNFVPNGNYILLVENESSQYLRAFYMSDEDVALYNEERRSKPQASYVEATGSNGSSKGGKKAKIVNGIISGIENTASNIQFLFMETPERSYLHFFTLSDNGVVIESSQTFNKRKGMKPDNKIAELTINKQ